MTEDYQELVFKAYKKKQRDQGIIFKLANPTTVRLKKECLRIYDIRYNLKDADILSVFFNVDKLDCDFRQIIIKSEPDDYRALWNHLKGNTGKTDEKNSDMLAWLIDFQPRPSFDYYKALEENGTVELVVGRDEIKTAADQDGQDNDTHTGKVEVTTSVDAPRKEETVLEEPPEGEKGIKVQNGGSTPTDIKNPKSLNKHIFIAATIILIAISGFFQLWKDDMNASPVKSVLNGKCMHWTGERYELIDCNSKAGTTPIITADTFKLAHQRKITRPDTLTRNALGKVWYAKIKVDSAEFYTDDGDYPLDTNKRLLPITDYMLNKYVFSKYAAKN